MKWFKHFSDASKSLKINELIDNLGLEGYARWFLLLELLNYELTQEDIDNKNCTFEIHFREISTKVHIKFRKKLETFLQKLSDFSLLSYEFSGNFIKIECPILLELQNKDSKYNRNRVVKKSPDATLDKNKNKKENKNNILPIVPQFESHLFDSVVQSWNEILGGKGKFKHVLGVKPDTTKNFFELVQHNKELRKITSWQDCFYTIEKNPILSGQNTGSSFVCSLVWLIDNHKIIDVLNGQYGARSGQSNVFNDWLEKQEVSQ